MASTGKAGSVETALAGPWEHLVVLDPTMASPTVSRQALLCTWTIILVICGSIETPLPMGLHCQNPLVIGAEVSKGAQTPIASAASSILSDDPFHTEGATSPMVLQKKRTKSKCGCLVQ